MTRLGDDLLEKCLGLLTAGLVPLALGVWWTAFPEAALRFYASFGAGYLTRMGPQFLRALGIAVLAITFVVVAIVCLGIALGVKFQVR